MDIADKIKETLNSPQAIDIKTVLAYGIKKTGTLTDDEIAEHADLIAEEIAKSLKTVNTLEPTDKQAKDAGVRLLEWVASLTSTKWDDRAVRILKVLI